MNHHAFKMTAALLALITTPLWAGELAVHSDFEGGSADVVSIDQAKRVVVVRPAGDPKRGWPCWWYVKVTGLTPGETLTLRVDASKLKNAHGGNLSWSWALPDRAAVSVDDIALKHTDKGKLAGGVGTYVVKADSPTLWLAWGPPFTPADAAQLAGQTAKRSPHAEAFELCKTNGGRPVPALRVTQDAKFDDPDRRYLWVQARQHAWEAGSSWVCKGFVDWLTSDDPRAESLRRKAVVYIVPIMDIDNTARGNGGKEGLPHDHNRDWSQNPHYASVRAAQQKITELNETGRLDLFLDLHNPGSRDTQPFYFISPRNLLTPDARTNLDRFIDAAVAEITGPLKLKTKHRESGAGYHKLWRYISKNWVTFNTHKHIVSVTLETSWNTPHSTTDGYMAVGMQQGLAIERYLRQASTE